MDEAAGEESTYTVPISAFYDDAATPNAVTPNLVSWSLHDEDDAVVNSRLDVSETPALTLDIMLSGDDLALPTPAKPTRRVTVEYTYDSTLGSDLPARMEISFTIHRVGAE